MHPAPHQIIIIGGGHAGVEAAWAAANLLNSPNSVALVTLDPAKLGFMSCNPAIGGLAKGQLVREIDALGGLMPLAADASGILFKLLNTSKGPAVHGPRCQSDKHAYAAAVQSLIVSRPEIDLIPGSVERLLTESQPGSTTPRITGVQINSPDGSPRTLRAAAVVITTGTFLKGLMHTGDAQTPGGRFGEAPANTMSDSLAALGFELGRLKTGTPPRLKRSSIDWDSLPIQTGDDNPVPFSDLTPNGWAVQGLACHRFPLLEQVSCRQTHTTAAAHDLIRANLHRAPMFSGTINSPGPRYCPSIEDKVVRFAQRDSHGVYLEPESLTDDWVYCNGISTSLPADIQDAIVRSMPGCSRAQIYRYGYAVEYDMVRPHQIHATTMTKLVTGLFLAGQINGTSGYEEAAAQGLVAGINAVRFTQSQSPWTLGRDQAYIGVLMDDLVTKTPVEPYRMFTSRAEHRLILRADNTADRLTPIARDLGLLASTQLGRQRLDLFTQRTKALTDLAPLIDTAAIDATPLRRRLLQPGATVDMLKQALDPAGELSIPDSIWKTLFADARYEPYIKREQAEIKRRADLEHRPIPTSTDYAAMTAMRAEAVGALTRFRPATFGQAARLEGITPADLTLLSVLVRRQIEAARAPSHAKSATIPPC